MSTNIHNSTNMCYNYLGEIMDKKDYVNIILLCFVCLVLIIIFKQSNNIYGSTTDWLSQHWVFPEYFRTLFYNTGKLFPNYAPNIGAGQNIYNFAYYGLLNPIILISYILPFVNMVDYIVISSIIIVLVTISLFYKWLRNNNFDYKISFITTFAFMLANPFIFHSHRHIMFINYMPFLILSLIGVDKYFESNKRYYLIINVFLLIMSSYFYSVGSLIVIGIYSIYKILSEKIKFKTFINKLSKIILMLLTSVLMAGILILPTIGIIANGRGQAVKNINLIKLLIPNIKIEAMLYSTYSLGFTAIGVVALINGLLSSDKKTKILSILLSIIFFIPIFTYLLNGLLYVRYKVLIPFMPLVSLLIAKLLTKIEQKKVSLLPLVIGSLIFCIFNLKSNMEVIVYLIDITIIFISFYCYYHFNKRYIFIIPIIITVLLSSFVANHNEKYVTISQFSNDFNYMTQQLINDTISNDLTYYRFNNLDSTLSTVNKIYHPRYYQTTLYSSTYNNKYNKFYYDHFKNAIPYRNRVITAQSSNILFQTLMGVKYIVTKNVVPIGYDLINNKGLINVYKNENVFPVFYVTDKIMDESDYEKLKYPYNLEPLLYSVVAQSNSNYNFKSNITKTELDYTSLIGENIEVKNKSNGYDINVANKDYIKLNLRNIKKDQILIIKFDILNNPSCQSGDIYIIINGIKNVLTCKEWIYHNQNYAFEYVISSNDVVDKLNIEFAKGHYDISGIETYILDYNHIKKLSSNLNELIIDINKTKGDQITGNIKVDEDGYFVTTIPYDDGFQILLNDYKVNYEVVNNSFIGFPIKKGVYEIKIIYKAPLFKEGAIVSMFGFTLFLFIVLKDVKKRNSV